MPEKDTGYLVNTYTGKVHKPECRYAIGGAIAPWRGVAISTSDIACSRCLGGVLPPSG